MKRYEITILKKAFQDIDDLFKYITEIHKAPLTAKKYTQGLFNEVRKLSIYANATPIATNISLKKYGKYPRRINFKKHAIIYTVSENKVVIKRIIPASLIK
jgi:plasmid stabilization system protein ParE